MEFKQLPLSTYEVRVECPGWKTVVRRVILSDTDKAQALQLRMTKGDGTVVLGSGPSLQELEDRIKSLACVGPDRRCAQRGVANLLRSHRHALASPRAQRAEDGQCAGRPARSRE